MAPQFKRFDSLQTPIYKQPKLYQGSRTPP